MRFDHLLFASSRYTVSGFSTCVQSPMGFPLVLIFRDINQYVGALFTEDAIETYGTSNLILRHISNPLYLAGLVFIWLDLLAMVRKKLIGTALSDCQYKAMFNKSTILLFHAYVSAKQDAHIDCSFFNHDSCEAFNYLKTFLQI